MITFNGGKVFWQGILVIIANGIFFSIESYISMI